MVQLATQVITEELTGIPSPVPGLKESKFHHYGVKEAVFPFNMFQEVDPILGPEMRSTGEVLGLASNFGEAFYKAAGSDSRLPLPLSGTVLISVSDRDKEELLQVARGFHQDGFHIMATGKTYDMITEDGIPAEKIKKLSEGRPNILDAIANKKIDLIVNTPSGNESRFDDAMSARQLSRARFPYMTTMGGSHRYCGGYPSGKCQGWQA